MISFAELENRVANKRLQKNNINNVNISHGLDANKIKGVNDFSSSKVTNRNSAVEKTTINNSLRFNSRVSKYDIPVKRRQQEEDFSEVQLPFYGTNDGFADIPQLTDNSNKYKNITSRLYGIPSLRTQKIENPAARAIQTIGVRSEDEFFVFRARQEEFMKSGKMQAIIDGVGAMEVQSETTDVLQEEKDPIARRQNDPVEVLPAFPKADEKPAEEIPAEEKPAEKAAEKAEEKVDVKKPAAAAKEIKQIIAEASGKKAEEKPKLRIAKETDYDGDDDIDESDIQELKEELDLKNIQPLTRKWVETFTKVYNGKEEISRSTLQNLNNRLHLNGLQKIHGNTKRTEAIIELLNEAVAITEEEAKTGKLSKPKFMDIQGALSP